MNYEIKDSYVFGKVLAVKGRPVITNYDNAMKLAERFRGTLQKTLDQRYMIKLPETATSIEECDCGGNEPTGKLMPQTYNQYPDHEVQMARQELYRSAKLALMIHDLLKNVGENQGLEGWVQRKITRAADYIESVFDYLDYEMRFPSEMNEANATMQSTTGSPTQQTQQMPGTQPQKPGHTQTPGMVKMAKVDTNGNIQGQPVMVPQAQVKSRQQQGFHVIGESASAGASSAGGIAAVATPMGGMISRGGVGSLFGGTYKQKKSKKKVKEGVEEKYKVTYDIYGSNKKKPLYTKTRTVLATSEQDAVNFLRKLVGGTNHRVEKVTEDGQVDQELKFKTDLAIDRHDRATKNYGNITHPKLKKKLKRTTQPIKKSQENESMTSAESNPSGPQFTGYWKGKDKGKPGNKMVGSD